MVARANPLGQSRPGRSLHARRKSPRRQGFGHRQLGVGRFEVEKLEKRTLLSGWSTVDTVLPPNTGGTEVWSMTADSAGNVYAAGEYGGQGLLREKLSGSSSFVTLATPAAAAFSTVFADPQGDVFVSNSTSIFERKAGGAAFAPVSVNIPAGNSWQNYGGSTIAADVAGNVFALGAIGVPTTTTVRGKTTTTVRSYDQIVEMKAGETSFTPVHQFNSFSVGTITIINSGPSQGMYILSGTDWVVSRSTDGGVTWTTAPAFNYSNGSGYIDRPVPYAIASDAVGSGNLYVAGVGTTREISGYTKVRGVQTPVYVYTNHWLVTRSSDGGATWTVSDDFIPPGNQASPDAIADLNGTVYVAGYTSHPLVRSNVGGTWQTVDDFDGDYYHAATIDPVTGTPYAGGQLSSDGWFIRSGPAAAPAAPATALTVFSGTTIASSIIRPDTLLDLQTAATVLT